MFKKFKTTVFSATILAACTLAGTATHAAWKVSTEGSTVYFGSIKKDKLGEVHSFTGISGTVADDGTVTVDIDLATVETGIKIRNTRMARHVFVDGPTAKLTAKVDMDALNAIAVGSTGTIDIEGKLSLGSAEVPVETSVFVVHLSETKVIASTQSMIMLSTAKAGLAAGIDKLAELAKLPSITRVSPVTIRLVLEK